MTLIYYMYLVAGATCFGSTVAFSLKLEFWSNPEAIDKLLN